MIHLFDYLNYKLLFRLYTFIFISNQMKNKTIKQ